MKISLSPKNCSCYYDDLEKVTTGALPQGSGAHITAEAAAVKLYVARLQAARVGSDHP